MSTTLRILLIVVSVIVVVYTLHKIRKAQLNIDDAFYWIIFSILLIVMSVFPNLVYLLSETIGFESPANLVFLLIIFLILVKLFSLSIELSVQKHRLNYLIQRIALMNYAEMNKKKSENTQKEKDN